MATRVMGRSSLGYGFVLSESLMHVDTSSEVAMHAVPSVHAESHVFFLICWDHISLK